MTIPSELRGLWHTSTIETALADCRTTVRGLSAAAAFARAQRVGTNELPTARLRSRWQLAASQFRSPLIYLLLLAATLAALLGEHRDAAVILVVVVMNAVIGTLQEGRAERSMSALQRLAGVVVRVRRDGVEQPIAARDLVVGDIVALAAGDIVPADLRLIEARALMASEATLTGESLPVPKQTDPLPAATTLADRSNLLFSGTYITAGRSVAVVVAIGGATEVGKIARLTAAALEPRTPLEQRISQLGRQLVTVAALLSLAVMAFGWWREIPLRDLLLVTISQMVSLVPEGLPVALTIALAVGMQRMARRRA